MPISQARATEAEGSGADPLPPSDSGADSATPEPGLVVVSAPDSREQPRILRFLSAERMLHWSLAIPFVLLYLSALMMFLLWNEPSPRTWRAISGWLHRIVGISMIVLPPLALLRGRSDWRMHLENMREGWRWTRDDFRWLLLFPRAAVDSRVTLPEQGKFNAAEKLNFMMVSATYPLYIVTGIMVLLPGAALTAYFAHMAAAMLGAPLVAGHIFMATINPSTRVGLSGMISGWVDREWAKHHYRRWYRERFEREEPRPKALRLVPLLQGPATVRCGECGEDHRFESWATLLERSFRQEPLFCLACRSEIAVAASYTQRDSADTILRHVEHADPGQPLTDRRDPAA